MPELTQLQSDDLATSMSHALRALIAQHPQCGFMLIAVTENPEHVQCQTASNIEPESHQALFDMLPTIDSSTVIATLIPKVN